MPKISLWADLLLTFWVVSVGVVFYGGYFLPNTIGNLTGKATILYAGMLLITFAVLARRYLHRSDPSGASMQAASPKKRSS